LLSISVVIPTLNAAGHLPACLGALQAGNERIGEILITDGGSRDQTLAVAKSLGVRSLTGPPGRGQQLSRGAAATNGDWLLFLHADTRLAPDWPQAVTDWIAMEGSLRRAGYFRFRLDDESPEARLLERRVAWRCRRFALPYGDQGLLISRAFYRELGAYRPIPLMEDVDMVRRIWRRAGRSALRPIDADAVTSATRFRKDGYLLRSVRNVCLLGLYFAGVPPTWLKRLYG